MKITIVIIPSTPSALKLIAQGYKKITSTSNKTNKIATRKYFTEKGILALPTDSIPHSKFLSLFFECLFGPNHSDDCYMVYWDKQPKLKWPLVEMLLTWWYVILLWAAISMAVVFTTRELAREFFGDKNGLSTYVGEFVGFCICVGFAIFTLI
jgi:hypothetical protein